MKMQKLPSPVAKFGLVLVVALAARADQTGLTKARWPPQRDQESLELFSPNHLEAVEAYFSSMDSLTNEMSIGQLHHAALVAQVHSKPFLIAYTHRYEDQDFRLTKWGGPEANQEACLRQLEQLTERVERQYEERGDGEDINLHQLLDTYGWHSSGGLLGTDEWPGNYHECLRLKINSTDGLLATRYCSAAFKGYTWPKGGRLNEILAYRAGVCLPKACDSARYRNKFELVEKLVKFNAREVDEDSYYLDYLYCLPDEQSTLRLWYNSASTVAFVLVLAVWIVLLVAATMKHLSRADRSGSSLFKSLSLIENIKSLLETSPREPKKVNLEVVEGIKVIAICYVITGHVLMAFSQLMSNGRETSILNLKNFLFLSANMTPSFAVNVFFSITGILTAYLMFKHRQSTKSIVEPYSWLAFVVIRYIKIMPIYLLVVAYEKYLAKYTGSGPFWDYATSSLGSRYQCEREPWLWTLLFGANFKNPLAHCIPSAWYLANDFQFFLVTPIVLDLLKRRPALGKRVTIGAILISYLSTVLRIATSNADLRAVHQFRLDGLKTYLNFLGDTYTQPQYRLPAYLCGLLMGYHLYRYDTQKCSKWPHWMKRYCKYSWLAICSCLTMPFIGKLLHASKFCTKISFGLLVPTYNLLFGLAAGIYVLLASTGNGVKLLNKLLASPIWRILSRLNLCVLLINIEVISYFAQTGTHLLYFDFKTFAALNSFSILMSYCLAAPLHVLFELPLQNLINNHLLSTLARRSKAHRS